jgi:hypothetical protein
MSRKKITPCIVRLEVVNKGQFSKISITDTTLNKIIWVYNITSRVSTITANTNLMIVGAEDYGIYIFSKLTGRRLVQPMYVKGVPTILSLDSGGSRLICLTNLAKLIIWNLRRISLVMKCNIDSIFRSFIFGESVVRLLISREERLVLVTSKLQTFIYSSKMRDWFKLDDNFYELSNAK